MDLAKIERVYTSYAKIYDRIFGKVFHEGRQSIIQNLNAQPHEKILEVGVGTGLALPMYPRHCQIVGIDFSEGMLDQAKQRAAEHAPQERSAEGGEAATAVEDDRAEHRGRNLFGSKQKRRTRGSRC